MARLPGKTAARPHAIPPRAKLTEADPKLKELKDQAEDLGVARKALDDAVSMTRGLWISFISLSAYLLVAVGSVTHVDLFLEKPLKLPLLLVDVPLVVFFWLAPILFVIVHTYLLLNLKLMSDNVRAWLARLEAIIVKEVNAVERYRIAEDHKLTIPNFFPVQLLAAPTFNRHGFIGWALSASVSITVVIVPVLLLLLFQVQFLPYHYEAVTWVQRATIIIDMTLVWFFWLSICWTNGFRRYWFLRSPAVLGTVSVGLLATFIATFPGELIHGNSFAKLVDAVLPKISMRCQSDSRASESNRCFHLALSEYLFDGPVDEVTGKVISLFANKLVLTNKDFVRLDDSQIAKTDTTVSLRGRNLEGALLARANLTKADFTGAKMAGANFTQAKLRLAKFSCGNGIVGFGKHFFVNEDNESGCTDLRGANLLYSELQGAQLEGTLLQRAILIGAQLQDATLDGAKLQGALLRYSQLQGSKNQDADFRGADLQYSNLQAANLSSARFQGAILNFAHLQGTVLTAANFDGAYLFRTELQGANLYDADFRGAVLVFTDFRQTRNIPEGRLWKNAIVDSIKTEGKYFIAPSEYEKLVESLISDIPKGIQQKEAIFNLRYLDPTKTHSFLSSEFLLELTQGQMWKYINISTLRGLQLGEDPQWHSEAWQDRIRFLTEIGCAAKNAPYVADSWITKANGPGSTSPGLLEFVGPYRPAFARHLLDTERCPGAEEISDDSKVQLQQWASEKLNCELPLPGDEKTLPITNKDYCFKKESAPRTANP